MKTVRRPDAKATFCVCPAQAKLFKQSRVSGCVDTAARRSSVRRKRYRGNILRLEHVDNPTGAHTKVDWAAFYALCVLTRQNRNTSINSRFPIRKEDLQLEKTKKLVQFN